MVSWKSSEDIGVKLREMRKLNDDMSREKLAEKSNVSESTIYKIEKGDIKGPKLNTLESLVQALGYDYLECSAGIRQGSIILDVDDTLIKRKDIPRELRKAGKQAIKEAHRELDCITDIRSIKDMEEHKCFSEDYILGEYGHSIPWYISTWLKMANVVDGPPLEDIINDYVNFYYDNINKTIMECDLFPGVKETLEQLSNNGHKLGAVSNSSRRAVTNFFREHNLLQFFQHQNNFIIGGGKEEKSAESIRNILDSLQADPEYAYICGDSIGDIQKGIKAGIPKSHNILIIRQHTDTRRLHELPQEISKISEFREIKDCVK